MSRSRKKSALRSKAKEMEADGHHGNNRKSHPCVRAAVPQDNETGKGNREHRKIQGLRRFQNCRATKVHRSQEALYPHIRNANQDVYMMVGGIECVKVNYLA